MSCAPASTSAAGAAPLKYVVTSAWTPANCTENFVWTRDLYLDYDRTGSAPLTLNKQGAGNIYLTTHGRGVEITQSGALGGVIDASGQSVSITTTSGSIGTQEAPFVHRGRVQSDACFRAGHLGARHERPAHCERRRPGQRLAGSAGALTGVAGYSANITSEVGEIDLRASSISSATLHGAAASPLTARVAANLAQLYVDHDADVTLLLSGVGRLGGELRSAGTLTIENTAEAGALTLEGMLEAESITVRVPGTLTLGGTVQAGTSTRSRTGSPSTARRASSPRKTSASTRTAILEPTTTLAIPRTMTNCRQSPQAASPRCTPAAALRCMPTSKPAASPSSRRGRRALWRIQRHGRRPQHCRRRRTHAPDD